MLSLDSKMLCEDFKTKESRMLFRRSRLNREEKHSNRQKRLRGNKQSNSNSTYK